MSYDAIVIPTYDRGATIAADTLNTLAAAGADMTRVHVFQGPKGDYQDAKNTHPEVNWHDAPAGYNNAQHHIWDTFPAGHKIINLDDDVQKLLWLPKHETKMQDLTDINRFAAQAFRFLTEQRLTLWGASPTPNPFYIRAAPRWATGAYLANGQFFGYINQPGMRIHCQAKQDWEITLLHHERAGAVGRINPIAAVAAPMRTNEGGLQSEGTERRLANEKAAADELIRRYPGLVLRARDKPGYASPIRLRSNRR